MNEDVLQAIIQAIRDDLLGTGVAAELGGRIYGADQVPHDAAFPRCYVGVRTSSRYNRASASEGVDRKTPFEVLFASTTEVSPTAAVDIARWDKATRPIIEHYVHVTDLVSLFRVGDEKPREQSDQIRTFIVGGGIYESYIQEP